MKDTIKNSNKYKRYKYYLFSNLIYLGIIVIIFLPLVFVSTDTQQIGLIMFLAIIALFTLVISPFIIYYFYRCYRMIHHIDKYKEYIGSITDFYTTRYLKSDLRHVTIYLYDLKKSVKTKVYYGELFDQIEKDIKVKVLYYEAKDDVVIIEVI